MERSQSTYKIKIPAGIDHGNTIRLSGKGESAGSGSVPGDLFVRILVRQEEGLERQGDDIHTKVHISYPQAVLGDKVDVKTVDGDKTIVIPSGTQPGQKIRLKGLGATQMRGNGRGDQYVHVVVEVPKKVSRKAKKLVQELKDEL